METSRPAAQLEPLALVVDRALEHVSREEWPQARNSLEQAITIDPRQAALHSALGTVLFRLGKPAAAGAAFAQASELEPGDVGHWVNRAIAHQQLQEPERMAACLRQALALKTDDPFMAKLLADLCRDAGWPREAAKLYGRLLDQHEDKVEVGLSLAACFEALGELLVAKAALQFVLQVDAGNALAQAALAALAAPAGAARPGASPVGQRPTIEVCCPTLNRPREVIRLRNSLPDDCIFTPSLEAQPRALTLIVNELFEKSRGDIVIMAADHLEFKPECIAVVRECFEKQFPDLDGVVGLNLCNLPHLERITEYCFLALGRKFIERFTVDGKYQGVFCPEYYHFYGDTEFGLFADKIGKFHYDERAAVFTWHPNAGNARRDRTYSASRSRKAFDDAMWRLRQARHLYWGESFDRVGAAAAEREAANPVPPPPAAADVSVPATPAFGRRHAEKIVRVARASRRVLAWGTAEARDWLRSQLPASAQFTAVDLADESALSRLGGETARFDFILVDGEAPASALAQVRPLLASAGTVMLHASQGVRHDEAKLAFTAHGHLGSCPERPGDELWWGGLDEWVANPRGTGALPVVICFFTKNTDYEIVAQKLIASCQRLSLEHRVVGVAPRGSWEANCGIKSEFILETWRETGRPVLWVDADAIMHAEPNLLRGVTADFAIHRCRAWEFASGTLFFNQSPAAGALLRRWVARCKAFPQVWDQVNLDLAWEETVAVLPLETLWLPEPYCRIFDLEEGRSARAGVIEHFQASRQLKAKVSSAPNARNATVTASLKAARLASRRRAWQLLPAEANEPTTLPAVVAEAVAAQMPSAGRVLCLGGGGLLRLLEQQGHEVHVLGPTPEELALMSCRNGSVGALTALPFPAGSFDLVVCQGQLELLPESEIAPALLEIKRVARRAALIVIHTKPDAEDRWLDHADQQSLWLGRLSVAGFEIAPLPGVSGPLVGFAWRSGEVAVASPAALELGPPLEPSRHPIVVFASDPNHPLFSSWIGQSRYPVQVHSRVDLDFQFPAETALVVTADCYNQPWTTLLHRAVEQGLPTLLLADGILEYRNTFENPRVAAGAIFQPVVAHKIACLGRSQARVLESWGNAAQTEITGSPRFDRYRGRTRRTRSEREPFKVLVMTAITPYFTEAQHGQVRQSLLDLKRVFDAGFTREGIAYEVEWRVTKGMQREIGVETLVTDLTGRELADVLARVDAVISTPSTAMVEAMLLGLPVAVLDYTNSPLYVQPAWRITAAEHIGPVLVELAAPPAPKMQFQDALLHDTLECLTPATPRLLELMDRMIRQGVHARQTGRPLVFAPRLLGAAGPAPAGSHHRAADLFPGQPQFHEQHLARLQVEVGQLRRYAAQLEHAFRQANKSSQAHANLEAAIQWRSRLEAAKVLVELAQPKAALEQLMRALKAAGASKQPDLTLEAMLEIIPLFARLDAGKARSLLETAAQLARRTASPESAARVAALQTELAALRTQAA